MGLFRLLVIGLLVYLGIRLWGAWSRALLAQNQPQPPKPPPEPVRDPHDVLGVRPDATASEVRAAYQSLIQQYHPDRVAGMGPELRELAERRTKEINAAYDLLKRS